MFQDLIVQFNIRHMAAYVFQKYNCQAKLLNVICDFNINDLNMPDPPFVESTKWCVFHDMIMQFSIFLQEHGIVGEH